MKFSRRMMLRGAGGVAIGLPLLETFAPKKAKAGTEAVDPYAIFFRQANGVAAEQNTNEIGAEPERFWPTQEGALTADTMTGPNDRALGRLVDYADRLLVVGGVNMNDFDYGDGHARGALQGLTGRGPTVNGAGGDSEAAGESLDHRIGAELNPDGRDSLFMYAGPPGGWLGGPCISYRDSGVRRAAIHDPILGYQSIMGLDGDQFAELVARQKSINDLVKDQMTALMSRPELSSGDRDRLQLHFDSIRDLEIGLQCNLQDAELMALEGLAAGYESDDGTLVLDAVRAHMDVAALAVACGYTRSVAIQVGNGNDGSIMYRDPDTNQQMENYHFISHRRSSHDSNGAVIPNSDLLHHKVDIQFADAFKYLLDKLDAYIMPDGSRLLDCGISVWYNDLGNGPAHGPNNIPHVIGGSAGGFLKQGQFIRVPGQDWEANHSKMLNTMGTAAGVRKNGDPNQFLDDFGDPGQPTGVWDELLA